MDEKRPGDEFPMHPSLEEELMSLLVRMEAVGTSSAINLINIKDLRGIIERWSMANETEDDRQVTRDWSVVDGDGFKES